MDKPTVTIGLYEELCQLALARKILVQSHEAAVRLQNELEQTSPYQALVAMQDKTAALSAEVAARAAAVRDLALDCYHETGDKAPLKGVLVKAYTTVNFIPAEMHAWAKENAPYLLVLDVKAAEKNGVPVVNCESSPAEAVVAADGAMPKPYVSPIA